MEKETSKLEDEESKLVKRLIKLTNDMIDYALTKITEKLTELAGREISVKEAFKTLEEHPEWLKEEVVDELILTDVFAAYIINISLKAAGAIIRQDRRWERELSTNGEHLIELMVQRHRPDLWELLKDKPKLTNFLVRYVLTKLGFA